MILLFLVHFLVFLTHPMPGIETAQHEPGHQEGQGPGMGACMTSVACVNPSLTFMALTARAADFAVEEMKKQNL